MKYTIQQLKEGINKALEFHKDGRAIRDAEKETGVFILHRIFPYLKRYYFNELHMNELPEFVGITEAQILWGKLKESEVIYCKRVKDKEKEQTVLGGFLKNSKKQKSRGKQK